MLRGNFNTKTKQIKAKVINNDIYTEISKKKDSEIIKEFNEDIAKLFAEYIEAKNGQYIIDLPQLYMNSLEDFDIKGAVGKLEFK